MRIAFMVLSGLMRARRGAVVLLALVSLAPVGTAQADTRSNISVQERRLEWLAGLAAQKQASVARIQESMRAMTQQIRRHNKALDLLEFRYKRRENQLVDTIARYDALNRQMADAASSAYMSGPTSMIGAVLDAQTLTDAGDAVHYTKLILARNRELAVKTAYEARIIGRLKAQDDAMIKRRATLLRDVRRQQDELLENFARAQDELEQIGAIRVEVTQLLATLRRTLRDEEIRRLGGTMPYGQWAGEFLNSIRAPTVRSNMVAMIAWQVAEGTLARWNPLATTWRMPGSTRFNGHGVQNYVSLEQGLDATRRTLNRPRHGYELILQRLAAASPATDTAWAINASDWCRGCADGQYVVELIPIIERYYERYARRRA